MSNALFSPKGRGRVMTSGKENEEEMIMLINKLNTLIKTYYKSTKGYLTKDKNESESTNNQAEKNNEVLISNIDLGLHSFVLEAKDIFNQLKQTRRKTNFKREINAPLYSIPNNSGYSSRPGSNFASPQKTLAVLPRPDSSSKTRNCMLSLETKREENFASLAPKLNTPTCLSERALELAKEVIEFLKQISPVEDTVFNKKYDIFEKKKLFDNLKNDLYNMIVNILDSSPQIIKNNESPTEKKTSLTSRVKSKSKPKPRAVQSGASLSGKDIEDLENQIKGKDYTIEKLNEDIKLKNETISKSNSKIVSLTATIRNLKNEIIEKESQRKKEKDDLNTDKDILKKAEKYEIEKMKKQMAKLKSQSEHYLLLLKEKEDKLKTAEKTIKEMKVEIVHLNEDGEQGISKIKNECKRHLEQISKLSNENKVNEKVYNTKISSLNDEKAKLTEQNNRLKSENENFGKIVQDLKKVISDKQKEIAEVKAGKASENNAEIEKIKTMNDTLKKENNLFKQTNDSVKELELKNGKLSNDLKDKEMLISAKNGEIEILKVKLRKLENDSKTLDEKVVKLTKDNKDISEKYEKTQKNYDDLLSLNTNQDQVKKQTETTLEEECKKLKEENEALQKKIEEFTSKEEKTKKELVEIRRALTSKDTEIKSLKENEKQEEEIKKAEKDLSDKIIALEKEKQAVQNEKVSIEKQLKACLEAQDKLEKDNNNLKFNLNEMIKENASLQKPSKTISPSSYEILLDKSYNNLHWFLLKEKNADPSYKTIFWKKEDEIDASTFNKFKTEKDIENENIEILAKTQEKLIRKIEEKDDEITKLQNSDRKKSSSLTGSFYGFKNRLLEMGSMSKDFDERNMSNTIPLEKYEKVINELNDANSKLNNQKNYIDKLKSENKELSTKMNDEKAFSIIGDKNNTSGFVDDEIKDVFDIPEKGSSANNTDPTKRLTQVKSLLQLLIHDVPVNNKTRNILTEICLLAGYKNEEIEPLFAKEKKGGLKSIFYKKAK